MTTRPTAANPARWGPILTSLNQGIDVVQRLRIQPLIEKINLAIKSGKAFDIQEDQLVDELGQILEGDSVKDFQLEGTTGLEDALVRNTELRRELARIAEINRDLRTVKRIVGKIHRTASLFIKEDEEVDKMSQRDQTEVIDTVLSELTEVRESVKRLEEECEQAWKVLTDRIKSIDTYVSFHKQYTFITLNQRD